MVNIILCIHINIYIIIVIVSKRNSAQVYPKKNLKASLSVALLVSLCTILVQAEKSNLFTCF